MGGRLHVIQHQSTRFESRPLGSFLRILVEAANDALNYFRLYLY